MTDKTTAPSGVVSSTELGEISREEWIRRYADRIHEQSGCGAEFALETARVGAEEHERMEIFICGKVVWSGTSNGLFNSPEEQADEEMSYWDDDGE